MSKTTEPVNVKALLQANSPLTPEELSVRLARGDQFIQEIVETGVDL